MNKINSEFTIRIMKLIVLLENRNIFDIQIYKPKI